jgi:hypothetical protein
MPWHASLQLDYSLEKGRTVARHRHSGPLRILQSLYPEGDAVCHNVLVHPPGGLVGGDTLELSIHAAAGSHGLMTTPGATRFYRADDAPARQITQLRLDEGARLEWLPQETLYYSGCRGGPGITKSDLFIINKTDLAPHVGANLDVMHADTTRMRSTPKGLRPFVMTNLKTLSGLGEVVSFIETKGMLVAQP